MWSSRLCADDRRRLADGARSRRLTLLKAHNDLSLVDFLDVLRPGEIGYRCIQSVWGKGYGSEAALAVRDLGLKTFGLKRIVLLIEPENIGSWRVAEKISMRLEKTITMDGLTVRVYIIEA